MRQNNVKKEIWLQNREESSAFNFERGKMEKIKVQKTRNCEKSRNPVEIHGNLENKKSRKIRNLEIHGNPEIHGNLEIHRNPEVTGNPETYENPEIQKFMEI